MIVIERLRALEKKMSATSASARLELNAAERRAQSIPSPTAEHADAMDKIAMGWLRVHMVEMWSSELRDIIAELGQEVGAVAIPLTDDEHEWLMYAVDHMLDDSEPEDKTCARVLQGLLDRCVVTSPAHTSEARDAARLDWLEKHGCWQFAGPSESDIRGPAYRWFDYDTDGHDYSATLREAIDAAIAAEAK